LKKRRSDPSGYTNRNEYRRVIGSGLNKWRVAHKETELLICADSKLETIAMDAVVSLRNEMEKYIAAYPSFAESLLPVAAAPGAPETIRRMCEAAQKAGVGPMAAVAGAFSEYVGRALLKHSGQVIVENGGDVFMKLESKATAAIFAGESPLSMKIGIEVGCADAPVSVCTSAASVGPSKSFGRADAAVVVSRNACLADACATRLGNEVKDESGIEPALEMIAGIDGVIGAAAVIGQHMGAIGDITLKNLP